MTEQYQTEMWNVPKDDIYAAIHALDTALDYMPQVKTDVPSWQKKLDQDIAQMKCALNALRKLNAIDSTIEKPEPTNCEKHGFHSWLRNCPYCAAEQTNPI
jgi:tRNA splicing ligase